ncbi:MAG: family 16 glycoside hydrolase [Pirellulaceae bacterium]|nr:family 16 glycoside hydrolase [Pirellulaceae bacterium]
MPSDDLPRLDANPQSRVDVQRTTLSIDVLGRFICNTWDEATGPTLTSDIRETSASFDAVVIGSGMYGAYCAEKIWRQGGKVLLLEAGPFLISEHAQNLSRIGLGNPNAQLPESEEGRKIRNFVWGIPWRGNQAFNGQAFCVGGKSLFWGGWSPQLTDDVLADFPSTARDYLKNNYEELEVQIGVRELRRQADGSLTAKLETDFIYDSELQKKLKSKVDSVVAKPLEKSQEAPLAVQGQSPGSGLFSFDKFSSLPILVDALREDIDRSQGDDRHRRAFLVPGCKVKRLNSDGGNVHEIVVFVDGHEQRLRIPRTTSVVLAAGCIESTRLALESFPTPEMGRNLMVHLRSNFVIRIKRSAINLPAGPAETAALHVAGKASKGGRFHIQMVASANRDGNAESIWFRSIPDTDILRAVLQNEDSEYVAIQFRLCGEQLGIKSTGPPNPKLSWIDLSPFEYDEFGMRRAYVNLATLPEDNELWDEMDEAGFALAESLAGAANTEYWISHPDRDGEWLTQRPSQGLLNSEGDPRGPRDALGTTYHEAGTLWMGEPPFPSVTDGVGRFRHIANAYCVDQSLFTRVGSANPVLTGLTLARQTARVIAPQAKNFAAEAGFTSLSKFSGMFPRLPDGWEHRGKGSFEYVDGVLETSGGIGLLIYTKESYQDFELKLQWRSPSLDNNSGVYLRIPGSMINNPDQAIKSGYEIQIDNRGNRPGNASQYGEADFVPHHQTGAVYPVHAPAVRFPVPNGKPSKSIIDTRPFGEWNDYHIIVSGNSIQVRLNGNSVFEDGLPYADTENVYPQGHIALQNHFKGKRVQFRNIQVRST